ncbi:MAG: S9 family peptidase [Hyphomonadaceae bacterium]|nr:S9 family peptidase [Hyphomonadaceae bacterium]
MATKRWAFPLALLSWLFALSVSAQTQSLDAARFVDPVSVWSADLSPDGQRVAYVQRTDTDLQIVIYNVADATSTIVQRVGRDRGAIGWVAWKGNERLVASLSVSVNENGRTTVDGAYSIQRIVAFDRNGANFVTMFEGQMNRIYGGRGSTFLLDTLVSDPDHILLQAWDNLGTGVWRADVATGRAERIADGAIETTGYLADGAGYPVMRMDAVPDGSGYRMFRRANGERSWTFMLEARRTAVATNSPDFEPVAPGPGQSQVYVMARRDDQDLSALYLYNTATGEFGAPLHAPEAADASMPWINAETHEIVATCEFAQRQRCTATNRSLQRHLTALNQFFENKASVSLVSSSASGEVWLLVVDGPVDPLAYFIYDTRTASVTPVANAYPSVDRTRLLPTEVVTYRTRDGVELWGYVTGGVAGTPRPMVVMPHGGPEYRDYYGYDAYAQFLVSRGYVVFQPNFRGSSGFGRRFADAGRGQWGARMQDDVTDGVRHMIESGAADPARVCIVGASYGGYAALAGATLTPELYQCAISIAGVSDLLAELQTERGGSISNYAYWRRSIGDPAQMRDQLRANSPRFQAARVTAPILLMHGEADTTVLIRQSELMEQALIEANQTVRFVSFPGAGHSWNAWERDQRLTLYRESENFLAQHLGSP